MRGWGTRKKSGRGRKMKTAHGRAKSAGGGIFRKFARGSTGRSSLRRGGLHEESEWVTGKGVCAESREIDGR